MAEKRDAGSGQKPVVLVTGEFELPKKPVERVTPKPVERVTDSAYKPVERVTLDNSYLDRSYGDLRACAHARGGCVRLLPPLAYGSGTIAGRLGVAGRMGSVSRSEVFRGSKRRRLRA
jgi:hypothetical protein